MAWQSGGGGGYPGVTSDGLNGLVIAHSLNVGDPAASTAPDFAIFNGAVQILDTDGTVAEGDPLIFIAQAAGLPPGAVGGHAIRVFRNGDISDHDYSDPEVRIFDNTASAQPSFVVNKQGTDVLSLTTRKSITGALSTVTDAAAKAVLTSVIAALTGIKVATNNTT